MIVHKKIETCSFAEYSVLFYNEKKMDAEKKSGIFGNGSAAMQQYENVKSQGGTKTKCKKICDFVRKIFTNRLYGVKICTGQ